MRKYVCAFRGRRDSYQVPLALAEAGLLDRFYTDAYAGPWMQRLAWLLPAALSAKVSFRQIEGIPRSKIHCLWLTTVQEHWRHFLGHARQTTYLQLDRRFSAAAASRARRSGADLFLYSSYAWEAFQEAYPHDARRVLFQYHPHPEVEARILAEDQIRFASIFREGATGNGGDQPSTLIDPGDRDAWQRADLVICASSFTRDSLVSEGLAQEKCVVIPYGIDLPDECPASFTEPQGFRALFVGSGVQRKGLHHLLLAWKSAKLPAGARLTLVCRNIEPPLARLAATVAGVDLVGGVSAAGLQGLYASSHLFVMPSLVEGFGQVYLESLAHGCPVIGTPNTCLPDLGMEESGIFITAVGDVDALAARLEFLGRDLPGNPGIRASARSMARRWTWARFRQVLVAALEAPCDDAPAAFH